MAIIGKRDRPKTHAGSSNDVRYKATFKQLDFVLYAQFAALHACHLQLVDAPAAKQSQNGGIKIPMLLSERPQPQFDFMCPQSRRHRNNPALPIPVINWSHSP